MCVGRRSGGGGVGLTVKTSGADSGNTTRSRHRAESSRQGLDRVRFECGRETSGAFFCSIFEGNSVEKPQGSESQAEQREDLPFIIIFMCMEIRFFLVVFLFWGASSRSSTSEDREVAAHKWCFCGTQNTVKKKSCLFALVVVVIIFKLQ